MFDYQKLIEMAKEHGFFKTSRKKEGVGEVYIGTVDITPDLARNLLTLNFHNRKKKKQHIEEYKSEMREGMWAEFSVIRITFEGWISDGQHRLESIVESGVTMENAILIIGVHPIDQIVIDTGSKRSFADHLSMIGYKNCTTLSSITRRLMAIDNGIPIQRLVGSNGHGMSGNIKGSPVMLEKYFSRHSFEALKFCNEVMRHYKANIPQAVLSMLVILFYRIDSKAADEYFRRLEERDFSSLRDPLYLLRKRIDENYASKHSKMPEQTMLAIAIKAWNYFLRGEEISCLRWSAEGNAKEKFPTPLTTEEVY